MKKNIILILSIIAAIIILPIAWYLASPLFIDNVVDEELPFEINQKQEVETQEQSNVESEEVPNEEISQEQETIEIVEEEIQIETDFEGSFVDADSFHKVSGKALVLSQEGTKILRFEDFESTNGPDLKVYLATDEQASEFISLGDLKGNIGNQNYELKEDYDLDKYNKVLIWCEKFGVLFGTAEIS